jgi:hypothetical protein
VNVIKSRLTLSRPASIGLIERILMYKDSLSLLTDNESIPLAAIEPLDRATLLGQGPFSVKAFGAQLGHAYARAPATQMLQVVGCDQEPNPTALTDCNLALLQH